MADQKKIFVTCEKVGGGCKVEAGGTLEDIVVLTTELLMEIGLSLAKEDDFDEMVSPEDIIEAISSTAIENACKRVNRDGLSH